MPDAVAPSEEIAEIMQVLHDDPDHYWGNEALQSRMMDLCRPERGDAPASVPALTDTQGSELASLESMIGDETSAYWKGPKAAELQSRFRALVVRREGGAEDIEKADAVEWRRAPADVAKDLSPSLIEEWSRTEEGFDGKVRQVQDVSMAVLQCLGDAELAKEFFFCFHGLSRDVQTAIFREAAEGVPNYVQSATDDEMAAFYLLDEGVLTDLWGDLAPRRVAAVYTRLNQCMGWMTKSGADEFRQWFRSLISQPERNALMWVLSAA